MQKDYSSSTTAPEKIRVLTHKLRFFQTLTLFLTAALLAASSFQIFNWIRDNADELGLSDIRTEAPYKDEIEKLLAPLRYSALPALRRSEVSLSINFKHRVWTLHNVRRFDEQGNILLDDGRFGACGELSAYMYQKVRPLLDPRYFVQMIRVSESRFFKEPASRHYALVIVDAIDPKSPKPFILDPSFRRYGAIDEFEDYRFYNGEPIWFLKTKNRDESYPVNLGAPVLIKKKFLLDIVVESVKEKFDSDNFALSIRATKRFDFSGKTVLSIRRVEGKEEITENGHLVSEHLKFKEYEVLRQRLMEFYRNVTTDAQENPSK